MIVVNRFTYQGDKAGVNISPGGEMAFFESTDFILDTIGPFTTNEEAEYWVEHFGEDVCDYAIHELTPPAKAVE